MNDIYTAEEMVSFLTDANVKDKKSNVYKLFKAFENTLREIYSTCNTILRYRCLNEATGTSLDLIGSNYNVSRVHLSDDMYRSYIKAAIARTGCDGTYNGVLKMLAYILNADVKDISFLENYETSESATVTIDKVPTKELTAIGMSIEQYSEIVQSILPVGINLMQREYEGSFAFATGEEVETDENTGFADNEQTTGGTLTNIIHEQEGYYGIRKDSSRLARDWFGYSGK